MSLEVLFLIFIALLVGAAGPIQAGVNATIAQYNGHPLTAAFTNTMVASAFLFILMLVARVPVPQMSSLAQAPWWAWTGGLFGAFFVFSALTIAPKLGAAVFIATTVAGAVVASLVIDHFGFIVYKEQPITPQRVIGALLVVSGMLLVQWKR